MRGKCEARKLDLMKGVHNDSAYPLAGHRSSATNILQWMYNMPVHELSKFPKRAQNSPAAVRLSHAL